MTDEKALLGDMIGWRRALHAIPEPGKEEIKTQGYIINALGGFRPDSIREIAGTGVECVFNGCDRSKAIAFRADMDALQIREDTGLPFASTHDGMMHACGHDAHMAIALATAQYASLLRANGELGKSVKIIFQPAEESVGGAESMIAEGALESPHAERVYGLHMMPDKPIGAVSCKAGAMMASTCELDIILKGKSAHGAMPQNGHDAVAAMSGLYTMIQTALSRRCDPSSMALFTAGKVSAGQRRNIIAQDALLECTARSFSPETAAQIEQIINDSIKAVECVFGVTGRMEKRVYYPAVINDASLFERFRMLAGNMFAEQEALLIAEDFSYYQMERPGLFYFVGCGDEAHTQPLHSDRFDFDERAMLTGARMNRALLCDWLKEE